MKELYIMQPYEVGSKKSKHRSLARVIPAAVVKEYEIDKSTLFALKLNIDDKKVTIYQTTFPNEI